VLTRVFPPDLVDRVVKEAGRTEQRQRLLPARVVVYYVLGLSLFSHSAYETATPHSLTRRDVTPRRRRVFA